MRVLPYITAGKILKELEEEGLKITRVTFYELEKRGVFQSRRSAGGWRVYTKTEANLVKELIKENYGLIEPIGSN